MGCTGKTKLTCNGTQFATCTKYEGELPEWSALDECADMQEVAEEIYETLSTIKEDTDLSTLDSECITLPIVTNRTTKTVFQTLIDFICAQSITIQNLETLTDNMAQQIQDLQEQNCP